MSVEEELLTIARQLRETNDLARRQLERAGNLNSLTVTHTGMGVWGAAAVVACFATWFALILFAMEIHDLRAWRDIHQNHISALEAQRGGK